MARFGGGGVFTQPVDGTVAHGAADAYNPVKVGGKASTSLPTAVDDGDRVNAYFDQYGRQHCVLDGWSATVGVCTGNEAHGAADVGNPVKTGGKAVAAEPAAVDDGDRVDAYFDLNGRQHVVVDASTGTEVSGDAAHDALDAGNPVKVGGRAHSSAPAAVANGDRVNAYFDVQGKLGTFSELDEAIEEETGVVTKGVMLLLDNGTNGTFGQCDASGNLKTVPTLNGTTTQTWAQLTAPGATAAKACLGYSKHTIQYTVASIDTSVTVRAEGSLDNTSWFNLSAGDADTTDGANGTYGMIFEGALAYIRFVLVSEDGGTAATIDAKYLGMV